MRLLRLTISVIAVLGLLLLPFLSGAAVITIQDPFNSGGGDVIGNHGDFDIDFLRFTYTGSTLSQIDISFNYENSAVHTDTDVIDRYDFGSVGGRDHLYLDVGDLLFSSAGGFSYGIALSDHFGSPNGGPSGGPVLGGHLYRIDSPPGVMTARDALNDVHATYRKDAPVWLWNQGNLSDLETLSLDISDGTAAGEFLLSITGFNNAEFLSFASNGFDVAFAVATCGNDVVSGKVAPVPEPSSALLLLAGFFSLAPALRRREKR